MKKWLFFVSLCLLSYAAFTQQAPLIKSVFFGGGSAYIDARQVAEIQEFVQSIEHPENYQISISSHTDNIGGVEYNQWLSEQRSNSVTRQLVNNNISEELIGRIDNGQMNPLYDNRTFRGRLANRRVDIIFTPLFL
jgi:OOP family OmpA-OmpF porin